MISMAPLTSLSRKFLWIFLVQTNSARRNRHYNWCSACMYFLFPCCLCCEVAFITFEWIFNIEFHIRDGGKKEWILTCWLLLLRSDAHTPHWKDGIEYYFSRTWTIVAPFYFQNIKIAADRSHKCAGIAHALSVSIFIFVYLEWFVFMWINRAICAVSPLADDLKCTSKEFREVSLFQAVCRRADTTRSYYLWVVCYFGVCVLSVVLTSSYRRRTHQMHTAHAACM